MRNRYSWTRTALALALLFPATLVFTQLRLLWLHDANYHGLTLVPFMAALLLWKRRPNLNLRSSGPNIGIPALALFTTFLTITLLWVDFVRFGALCFILNLFLLAWSCFAGRALRSCLAPLIFLVLMVPPSDHLMTALTVHLQELFSFTLDKLAPLFFTDYLGRHHTNLQFLNTAPMTIAPECSGIRSLFGLIIVAACWAILHHLRPLSTVFLLSSSVAIALAGNLLRILTTITLRLHHLEQFAIGTFHGLLGIIICLLECIIIAILAGRLRPPKGTSL